MAYQKSNKRSRSFERIWDDEASFGRSPTNGGISACRPAFDRERTEPQERVSPAGEGGEPWAVLEATNLQEISQWQARMADLHSTLSREKRQERARTNGRAWMDSNFPFVTWPEHGL